MISESEEPHYLARHARGGYLTRHWIRMEYPKPPGADVWSRGNDPVAATRFLSIEDGTEWLASRGMTGFGLTLAPVCACCGDPYLVRHASGFFSPYRCEKHADRNPCVIEGCKRTTAAPLWGPGRPRLANNQAICGTHWRRYVPPGSPLRRTYLRFFRIAKQQRTKDNPSGWTRKLNLRFERFWRGMVKTIRRRADEGHIDEAEIAKIMGWDTT